MITSYGDPMNQTTHILIQLDISIKTAKENNRESEYHSAIVVVKY